MESEVETVEPVDGEVCKSLEQEPDETLAERIIGLTEMIPPEIRIQFKRFGNFLLSAYRTTCDASWIFFTTGAILYMPILFETERQRDFQSPNGNKKTDETISSENFSQRI